MDDKYTATKRRKVRELGYSFTEHDEFREKMEGQRKAVLAVDALKVTRGACGRAAVMLQDNIYPCYAVELASGRIKITLYYALAREVKGGQLNALRLNERTMSGMRVRVVHSGLPSRF